MCVGYNFVRANTFKYTLTKHKPEQQQKNAYAKNEQIALTHLLIITAIACHFSFPNIYKTEKQKKKIEIMSHHEIDVDGQSYCAILNVLVKIQNVSYVQNCKCDIYKTIQTNHLFQVIT